MDIQTLIQKVQSGTLSAEERGYFFATLQSELEALKAKNPDAYLAFITNLSNAMDAVSEGLGIQ